MFRIASSAKPVMFAALIALAAAPAIAQGVGNSQPNSVGIYPQRFAISAGRLDLGAQAYPSTASLGADAASQGVNHVTRVRVIAYQTGLDVGSQAYPMPH